MQNDAKVDEPKKAKQGREKPVSLYPLTTEQAFKVLFDAKVEKPKKKSGKK
jgi:hypothetical protein